MAVKLEPVLSRSWGKLAGSVTCPLVNDLTIMRNDQKEYGYIKRFIAEIGYLVLTGLGAMETMARAVLAVVVISVLGITYFIGRFFGIDKLKALSLVGMKLMTLSLLHTIAATVDAAFCLIKDNFFEAPIPLEGYQKVHELVKALFPEKCDGKCGSFFQHVLKHLA